MMRHLTTLVLAGVLGTLVMAGNAEACHKKKCACAPAPVACAPAPVVRKVHCALPVKTCAPKVKKCGGGGLFAGLCHKRPVATVACATPVSYAYSSYPTVAPSGQYIATPQH
ncbi:MAG: hypothetical protein ACLQGP_03690 [Isosphaeraceae bacterium]